MTARTYSSPAAFKQALEHRLRASCHTGVELARNRQLLVFDRFLARVVAVFGEAATLKGGLVLEFRLGRARSTKDIDLRLWLPNSYAEQEARESDAYESSRREKTQHPSARAAPA